MNTRGTTATDTSTSARLDPDGDYISVRVTARPGRPQYISVAYDDDARYRRMIRRINEDR